MPPAPVYAVFRRRSLRRPALIFVSLLVIFGLGQFIREMGLDAQHSTHIAFKYAGVGAGRAKETVTRTLWATRTLARAAAPLPTRDASAKKLKANAKSKPKNKDKEAASEEHTFHPSGLLHVNALAPHPIPILISRAEAAWARKLASATTTLRAATLEYRRRYRRAPPKGFDVWWAYTKVHAVQLPDEYEMIEHDLGPFWGAEPRVLQEAQRKWEAHADSYTIGIDDDADSDVESEFDEGSGDQQRNRRLAMLNFTLPSDERVRRELAAGGFQIIDMLRDVEEELPPFRAVFSPHDNPNLVLDHELREMALEAAKKGIYIDPAHPPRQKWGWRWACPPRSPAWLDDTPFPDYEREPRKGSPSVPGDEQDAAKTFIHDPLAAMDPCLHPVDMHTHGSYLSHGVGPGPHRALVPQFSYSVTPLHADIRVALPINWVPDEFPHEGRPPPFGFSWAERVDARIQWRGSNTGLWHAADGRWRDAHRIRLAAFAAGVGGANISVLDPGAPFDEGLGGWGGRWRSGAESTPLFDVAFAGRPLNCEKAQCAVLEGMFEWRKGHDLKTAARYKYILDVDGNGWSSRFKRLMNSGSLIFKATTYPEWFTERLAPWVHYIPIQNTYSDLLDALLFFRAHDKAAERIAAAGREWSRRFWRKEDMVAYMYRLFLEYARLMSLDRDAMSFEMWPDEREDAARERALMARWERKMEAQKAE
ncbi:glycosyl transferase family 90-domain-containing protein [Mycena sanguinolenta]|nr:glycosyl transferase family 90-domain-containing protein [Mycena sanguinolenta]